MNSINNMVRIGAGHLRPDHVVQIDLRLTGFLAEKKPFLQPSYTLRQLSEDTQISLHHLSAFINQYYGMKFNDLINHYRVHYCKQKLQNEEWRHKKLEAIGMESGFNNRNTFSIAFKKVTGVSPSGYLKNIRTGVPYIKEEV